MTAGKLRELRDGTGRDLTFAGAGRDWTEIFQNMGLYLLPNKIEDTYRRLLKIIQNKASDLNTIFWPQNFEIDYELAFKNSITTVLPHIHINIIGCLIHLLKL